MDVIGVAAMRAEELNDFDARTFKEWDRASLGKSRRVIALRRRELSQ
jgi:hypothetical protein